MHLLLGSIGVIAETSEIQRQCFNQAFAEAGLSWHWDREEYARLLNSSGGKRRVEEYARKHGDEADAETIHARKSELFQQRLEQGIEPRPGIREAIESTRARGNKLGFVTTTSEENVDAILKATGINPDSFDLITHSGIISEGKPDPKAYLFALGTLGITASETIAVEDNSDGFKAAKAAGLECIALPGLFHNADAFVGALDIQDRLELTEYKDAA